MASVKKYCFVVITLLLLLCYNPMQAVKTDSTHFSNVEMNNTLPYTKNMSLADVVSCPGGSTAIKKATVFAYLYMGNTYTRGSNTWSGTVSIEIRLKDVGGIVIKTFPATLSNNQGAAEQLIVKDFTAEYPGVVSIDAVIMSKTLPSSPYDTDFQLAVYYREEFKINVGTGLPGITSPISTSISSNPVTFTWTTPCSYASNFQFQLLRVYNINPAKISSESDITATIDWNQAMSIETGSSATSLTLTLAEGTGFYLWRVRAIGTVYDGGISDSRNWGSWSTSDAQGSTKNISTSSYPTCGFYYTQFNDNKNWIYSRTFSEGDVLSTRVRISEKMIFANGLQQQKQTQTRMQSQSQVLAGQTVYDWSGRPALTSLMAPPDNNNYLAYRDTLVKDGDDSLYVAIHYDNDGNYNNPQAMSKGAISRYYSNVNADLTVPNAESFPYSRSLYDRDGTARVKEQSGPGSTFKLKTTLPSYTTKAFYGSVSDPELVRVFGDEAPEAKSVHKTVTIDPNETVSVNYIDKEGKTIATCIAMGADSLGNRLDTLSSQGIGRYLMVDTVKGNVKVGNNIISSKPFILTSASKVTVTYKITARDIELLCMNFCKNCDYTIDLIVRSEDDTYTFTKSKVIAAANCSIPRPKWDTTFTTALLSPGKYYIEKRVHSNSIKLAATDSTGTLTYLTDELNTLRKQLQDTANAKLSCITSSLATSNLAGFYSCLGVSIDYSKNVDSAYANYTLPFNVGCANINIPVLACPTRYDCSDSTPDFEGYFNKRWAGTTYVGTDGGGFLKYLPNDPTNGYIGFQTGQFNTMIGIMINQSVYTCNDVWKCWEKVTQNYASQKQLESDNGTFYKYNLLEDFLACTGTIYKGYSTTDAAKYRDSCFKYFYYAKGNSTVCDSAMKVQFGVESGWGQDTLNYVLPNKQEYSVYYGCIRGYKSKSKMTPATSKADAECAGNGICEGRFESFKQAIIRMYHNDSIYVEGDRYKLVRDTTWGQKFSYSKDTLTSLPSYKTIAEIECAARSLVDECKKSCVLTEYKTGSHVDSVGTRAQVLAMQKAMAYSFEIKRATSACTSPYVTVKPRTSADTSFIKLWENHYGCNDANDRLWDIVELKKGCGGYVLAGWTNGTDTISWDITQPTRGGKDYWIIKVNQNGVKEWDQRFGGNTDDTLRSIIETSDGGFLIGGTSMSRKTGDKTDTIPVNYTTTNSDYWVVKLDPMGNIIWNKEYGGSGTDVLQSVTETSNGYYLLGGYSNSDPAGCGSCTKTQAPNSGSLDFWLVKVNAKDGTLAPTNWNYRYGSNSDDYLTTVRELKDKNYLLAGFTSGGATGQKTDASKGGTDYWIVKIDTSGVQLWDTVYGGSSEDYLYSMEPIQADGDSGIVLAGTSISGISGDKSQASFGSSDYWVVRIDQKGVKKWDKIFGGNDSEQPYVDRFIDIKETKKKGFFIGGSSKSWPFSVSGVGNKTDSVYPGYPDTPTYDYWVVRLDSSGNKIWDRSFGGYNNDFLTAVDIDNMGDYWIAGYSFSDNSGNKTSVNYDAGQSTSDYWVIGGRDYCRHDSLCFKWVEPVTFPDSLAVVYTPISCDSATAAAIYNSIQGQVGTYIDKQLEVFKANYIATCSNPDSLSDTLYYKYRTGLYHHTLYYYDRAGNLVRTVSPAGVVSSASYKRSTDHPSHTYVTKYKYNSLKQLIQQYTPDGDTTWFYYDYKGELRFSMNKKQKALSKYSYTKYDNLGRVIEVGQSGESFSTFPGNVNVAAFPTTTNDQRTYTVYTSPASGIYYLGNKPQRYLQNRVSYTYTDDNIYTYHSYDPHGNVEWLIQDIPGLGKDYIRYDYDLVSNKVLAVHYNEGAADEFHHRYSYDADQRIVSASTAWGKAEQVQLAPPSLGGASRGSAVGWDNDATYKYYPHGPLKRMEIGEDKVQGVDYVYTINGWLKAINNVTPYTADDPGADNNTTFSRDVFGMVLGYHSGDFNRTGSPYNPSDGQLVSSVSSTSGNPGVDLFNGNVSSWTLRKDSATSVNNKLKGFKYRYDQMNKLKTEDYYENPTLSSWSNSQMLDSRYTYDGNGNIDSLKRWGYNGSINPMDNMKFSYFNGTNRLKYVTDGVSDGDFSVDADNQSAYSTNGNYKYTAIGERAKDIKNGIDTIIWTAYGKVKSIKKTNGDSLGFTYNVAGNRVMKYYKPNGSTPTVTYYVKDAIGNDMSIYERTTSGANYVYKQVEVPIYGSKMIGVYKPNITTSTIKADGTQYSCFSCALNFYTVDLNKQQGKYTRALTKKEYFMKDHLDNIHTVFTDRKQSTGYADVVSFNNYYAYGMLAAGTNMNYQPNEVRYGMTNKEKDDEIFSQTGASVDLGDKFYDVRLPGGWRPDSKEAVYPGISPYAYSFDNPIIFHDPDGKDGRLTIEKNPNGGGTITLETTIHLYGANASGMADQYNKTFANLSKGPQTFILDGQEYTVNIKVTFTEINKQALEGMVTANNKDRPNGISVDENKLTGFKPGDNVLEVDNSKKLAGGASGMSGIGAQSGVLGARSTNSTATHEGFHMLGFDDASTVGEPAADIMEYSSPSATQKVFEFHSLDVLKFALKQPNQSGTTVFDGSNPISIDANKNESSGVVQERQREAKGSQKPAPGKNSMGSGNTRKK